jgi:hypothetical protein
MGLMGKKGGCNDQSIVNEASKAHPNWWIDNPDPAAAEGVHPGAKSVSQWRVDFLRDFAARMLRCKTPKSLKR